MGRSMNSKVCKTTIAAWVLRVFIVAAVLWGTCALSAGEQSRYREGEVLVKFKDHMDDVSLKKEEALGAMGMTIMRRLPLTNSYLVRLSSVEPVMPAVRRLRSRQDIKYAEPNFERQLSDVTPNDPLFGSQWAHLNIHSTDAWQVTTGSSNTIIAVVDSGVDYTHNDLRSNIWSGIGFNAINGTADPMDDDGHGTHVAGIIGAVGNNGTGVAGVNWQTSIMALKFIDIGGTGAISDEIEAIDFARQNGARVVNMSFGSGDFSTPEMEAIQNSGDILFFASAGNERANNDIVPIYPANIDLPNIVSVAASDSYDQPAFFSNFGRNTVAVHAPGIDILSTVPGNGYESMSGTSMSVPFASGLAGLILAANPSMTMSQLKDQILRTVDPVPELQGLSLTGGRINAFNALSVTVRGPYIYSLSPERGSAGTNVTIRGSRFGSSPGTVIFSNSAAATIVSWSNERIVVTVPDGVVAGPAYVTTSEGKSNEVIFEVTPFPTNVRVSFPHVMIEKGLYPFLIISNPLESPANVYTNIVELNGGEQTLKIIVLGKFEKRVINLMNYGQAPDSLFVECESEQSFGAAAVIVPEGGGRIIALPPLIGGPLHLVGGITPR